MENNIPQFGTKEFNTFFSDLCDKNLGGNTKNKIKQTAVEFLEKELNELLVLFSTKWDKVNKAIYQAKEMEKKQIIEAHGNKKDYSFSQIDPEIITGEQYYKNTFENK
jgi:hypothetical protein